MPTHTEAMQEAIAACPPSARAFYTLEIWQSSFDAPARVVANVGDDMMFGIEAGAPRDGGAMVTFTACPLTADYPEQRDGHSDSRLAGAASTAVRDNKLPAGLRLLTRSIPRPRLSSRAARVSPAG